jgi:hypothetical protein
MCIGVFCSYGTNLIPLRRKGNQVRRKNGPYNRKDKFGEKLTMNFEISRDDFNQEFEVAIRVEKEISQSMLYLTENPLLQGEIDRNSILELKNQMELEFSIEKLEFASWPISYQKHLQCCQLLIVLRQYAVTLCLFILKYLPSKNELFKARINAIYQQLPPITIAVLKLQFENVELEESERFDEQKIMEAMLRDQDKKLDIFKGATYLGLPL